jgi:anti-anti-sigma factor
MSAVTFLDARGLSLLLLTQNRLTERGLRCRIVSPSHVVRRLLELVDLDEQMTARVGSM